MIHNGNWTEWSAIQSEITGAISKSRDRFYDTQFNCHFITAIMKSHNSFRSTNIYIYSQYLKAFTSHFVCIQKWYDKDRKWCDLRQRDTQRRFPPKYNANIFKTIQSTFRSLEMHSTGCFKSLFRFFIRLNFTNYLKKPFIKLSMLFIIRSFNIE